MANIVPRRIIQIATSEAGAVNGYSRYVIALADDGTLWQKDVTSHGTPQNWMPVEPLPDRIDDDDRPF